MARSKVSDERRPVPPGEFEFIADILAPLSQGMVGAGGLTDDAAVLPTPEAGNQLVVTTDTMVEGIHFPIGTTPQLIARKLLRVNLSDLAAMAAKPWGYSLSLALPGSVDTEWLTAFASGLAIEQDNWDLSLLGGDTVRSSSGLVVTVSMLGQVEPGRILRRSGAMAGDVIFVSGTIGDAGLGLRIRSGDAGQEVIGDEDLDYLVGRLELPTPRLELAVAIVGFATAGLDVSDGLVADLGHICSLADLAATIELPAVPISQEAQRVAAKLSIETDDFAKFAMTAGDDYELLFTVRPENIAAVEMLLDEYDWVATRIGTVGSGNSGVQVLASDGNPIAIESPGYRHF
jgi:thiamine-monophosphate kinase